MWRSQAMVFLANGIVGRAMSREENGHCALKIAESDVPDRSASAILTWFDYLCGN
jgi:hypothetical protein